MAIDGDTNGVYAEGSMSCTEDATLGDPNWWKVDLGGPYEIFEIKLYNRIDCCDD